MILEEGAMPRRRLGRSDVEVSLLGFGTGTTASNGHPSAQSGMGTGELGALLRLGLEVGITWWDTSDDYQTHAHVREGLAGVPRSSVQISSKTHANQADEAHASLDLALQDMEVAWLDLYFLHDVDDPAELDLRLPAFEALKTRRARGDIRAIALSSHNIDTLEALLVHPAYEELDVVMTNFNRFGDHMDASLEDYSRALAEHHSRGRGILVMKAIGEGRLAHVARESIQWNASRSFVDAVLVGIQDADQIFANAAAVIQNPLASRRRSSPEL
ncbi:MAG: aldo/keto reductase [Candidatus Sericytochromatia bacterium]|nr:aldo/keto reductase [Candidatus Sericytochromatia bacterium]